MNLWKRSAYTKDCIFAPDWFQRIKRDSLSVVISRQSQPSLASPIVGETALGWNISSNAITTDRG